MTYITGGKALLTS